MADAQTGLLARLLSIMAVWLFTSPSHPVLSMSCSQWIAAVPDWVFDGSISFNGNANKAADSVGMTHDAKHGITLIGLRDTEVRDSPCSAALLITNFNCCSLCRTSYKGMQDMC